MQLPRIWAISRALVYRLASRYRLRAQTSSLLPFRRGRAPRSRLLDPEVEALICTVVERIYLQPERPRISDLLRAVETECQQRGLKAPAFHTLQARLRELDQDHLVRRRFGAAIKGRNLFSGVLRRLTERNFPSGYKVRFTECDRTKTVRNRPHRLCLVMLKSLKSRPQRVQHFQSAKNPWF